MNKFIFHHAIPLLMIGCKENEYKDEYEGHEDDARQTADTLPYAAAYSLSFKMNNPEYAKTILQGSWKDGKNNSLYNLKSWFADTIEVFIMAIPL